MNRYILILLYISFASANTFLKDIFGQWKHHHDISYETALEERYRFSVFAANYAEVLEAFVVSPIADTIYTFEKYEFYDTFCFIR